ncbi:vesicle-associated membrane protein 7-like [Dermacentor albipictus]|uniref:vesicle-associated membrane protein 7-like n=1 Tax=Dermacentor albipictus TaxID=60249 RepID=UPI0031FDDE27
MASPIEFCAIARETTVLVSHRETSYDFEYLLADVLQEIPPHADFKTTRSRGGYVFHLLVEQGLIYICATLPEASMHQSFTCLFLIKQRFLEGSLSSRAWTAQEHELDRDFGSVIADIINNCNSGRTGDQISQLHRQVEDVRGIMAQNIERVVERGDRLDSLLEKTQDLEQAGTVFRATAKKVNRHMCLRNARMMIVIGIIVAGVITIITLFATGVIKT